MGGRWLSPERLSDAFFPLGEGRVEVENTTQLEHRVTVEAVPTSLVETSWLRSSSTCTSTR